jgi:uncharacterized membrane protein HdeD (DUF308 family)
MTTPIDPAVSFSRLAAQVWYLPVIRGVMAILFGIIAWIWPSITAMVVVLAIGILAVVNGIVELVEGIRQRSAPTAGLHVVIGLLGIAVGTLLLVWPGKTAEVLAWSVGLWALLAGLFQCAAAWALRSAPASGWGWNMFAGLLGVAFGVLVLANVSAGLVSIVWLIALWAIVWGALLIFAGFTVRSAGRRVRTI